MRNIIILTIILSSISYAGFCQYIPKFRSLSQQEMMAIPMMMAQKAQATRDYLDKLTSDILEIRGKTTDSRVDSYLSKSYKELCQFYDQDLADNQIITKIRAKEREIRETLVEIGKTNQSESLDNTTKKKSDYKSNSDNIETIYKSALEKLNNNDFEGSLIDINHLIDIDPNVSQAYFFRGYLTFYYKKNAENAINDFSTALQINPTDINSLFLRANCFESLENFPNAIVDYTQILKIDSEVLDAYYRRGICKSNLGDQFGAIKDYDYIINKVIDQKKQFKDLATVYNNKAWCLVLLNKPKEGLPFANESIKNDESLWYSWDTRGEIFYKIGEYQKCINDMDRAITIEENANSLFYRGLAKIKLGKKTEACDDLSRAGELGKAEVYDLIRENCK